MVDPIRRCLLLALGLFALIAPPVATAQTALKGPLRIVVGFAAGGSSDIAARLIADKLKDELGQPVIVENKTGAGGRIAAEALKTAPADGTTLLLVPVVVPVLAPLVYRQLAYDPAKDFAPVTQIATYQFGYAVGANHPAKNVAELIAWMRANPTQANFGSPAPGSLPHFFGLAVGRATGVDMVHVAYKGGAPLATDLMGGQIPVGIDSLSDLLQLHRAGKIRIIATSGAARSPLLPEVATFREQGFPSIEGTGWIGIYAPAKTPKAIVEELSARIVKVVRLPDVRDRLLNLGYEPTGTTPEELSTIMAADTARWGPIIKASGFTAE